MKWIGGLTLSLLIIGGITCCGNNATQPTGTHTVQPSVPGGDRVPGEYIVTIYEDDDVVRIREIFKTFSVQWIKDLGHRRFLIKVEKDPGPAAIEQEGAKSDKIKYVQPNYVMRYH